MFLFALLSLIPTSSQSHGIKNIEDSWLNGVGVVWFLLYPTQKHVMVFTH